MNMNNLTVNFLGDSTSMIQPQEEYIREHLCPDGLHPNDLGHRIIADRIKGFLLAL